MSYQVTVADHRTGGGIGPARGAGGDDHPPGTVRRSGVGASGGARLVRYTRASADGPALGGLRATPRGSRRAEDRGLLPAVVTGPRHFAGGLLSADQNHVA